MPCLDENTVAALLAGSLAADSVARVDQHIEECADCRQLVAALVRSERAESPEEAATRPSPGPDSLTRGTPVGRYVLLERLGAGGMGIVYSAYDPTLERKVAVKLVREPRDPSTLGQVSARLLREGKAIAQLSHPNVVAVYDMGIFQDQVFVAMELVDGATLREWLRESKRSWGEVLEKFLAAGEGLWAAHRARLIHRDFKPENVLLGKDGRVRVTDFGLARPTGLISPPSGLPAEAASPPLAEPWQTHTGAVLGTPAYMAPEQLAGRGADELSDQFAFSVALFEALFGARPYQAPADPSSGEWRFVEPTGDAQVPVWLRRALRRGLALRPAERFGSMRELLDALAADPRRAARRRLLVAAAVPALAALVGVPAWWGANRESRLCQGAGEVPESAWGTTRKQSLKAAFLATQRADAPDAADLATGGLEAYFGAWSAMRQAACVATRVKGEQSDQILGLRMACLDRRKTEAEALIDLFARADRDVVAKAAEAVHALTGLTSCADAEALLARVRPPEDPLVRQKVEALRAHLGEAKALLDTDKLKEGRAKATEAVQASRALAYRPVLADSLVLLGRLQERLGELGPAETSLVDAIAEAEAGHHDEAIAQAGMQLMLVLGARQARFAEARAWGKLAEAAVLRIGGDPELRARLMQTLALVLSAEGKLAAAIEQLRQALALREKMAPDPLALAEVLTDLGASLRAEGNADEALAAFQRALSLLVPVLGEQSDRVASARNGIGSVLLSEGRFEEALKAYREALATFEKTLGPTHFKTLMEVNNIGVVYAEQSRFAEALPYFERVLASREATLGIANPRVADAHSNLGMLLIEVSRLDEAQAHFEKAREILQSQPLDHFSQAEHLLGFAKVSLARGQPAKALPLLEKALSLCEGKEGFRFDSTRARVKFASAQALWEGRRERGRALDLATQARDGLAGLGRTRFRRDLGLIETWIAAHPLATAPASPGPK